MRLPLPQILGNVGAGGGLIASQNALNAMKVAQAQGEYANALQRANIANLYMTPEAQVLGNPLVTGKMNPAQVQSLTNSLLANTGSGQTAQTASPQVPGIMKLFNMISHLKMNGVSPNSNGSYNMGAGTGGNNGGYQPPTNNSPNGISTTPNQQSAHQNALYGGLNAPASADIQQNQQIKKYLTLEPSVAKTVANVGPVSGLLHDWLGFQTPQWTAAQNAIHTLAHIHGIPIPGAQLPSFLGGESTAKQLNKNAKLLKNKLSPEDIKIIRENTRGNITSAQNSNVGFNIQEFEALKNAGITSAQRDKLLTGQEVKDKRGYIWKDTIHGLHTTDPAYRKK